MWPAFRVLAPALQPTDELRWVLLRAFAPLDASAPRVIDRATVLTLSRELDLAARIATRHALTLGAELGIEATREMTFHRLRAVATDRLLWAVGEETTQLAAALGIPTVLMKHAALRRARLVVEGERHARDVDLLVPEALAAQLQEALSGRGFTSGRLSPHYHLPPLKRRPGEVVEVHTALWGVQLSALDDPAMGVDATSLIASGLIEQVAANVYIPSRPILATYAIAHGLVQHRTSPEGYPIMRVMSDLCSLDLNDRDAEAACEMHAPRTMDRELVGAALRLSRALKHGCDAGELDAESPEFELLSHLVAAGTDPAYRRALRFERVAELSNMPALVRAVRGAFSDSGPRLERPSSRTTLRSVGAFGARPISLALELARSGVSYTALRLRRRIR